MFFPASPDIALYTFIASSYAKYFTKIALNFSFLVKMYKKSYPKRFLLYNLLMDKLFNPNNPVMILLSRIFDLIALNVCFVIACIPVFTVGPALTALYDVALKMADGEFGYTVKNFFASFRENFRQGLILWILTAFTAIFLAADLYVILNIIPPEFMPLQIPVWLLLFMDASVMIYAFPVLAKYEQTVLSIIRNSILLSISNIPLTVFIIVILGVIADLSLHNGSLLILFFSIFLFIGCALLARVFAVFFRRIFLKISDHESV